CLLSLWPRLPARYLGGPCLLVQRSASKSLLLLDLGLFGFKAQTHQSPARLPAFPLLMTFRKHLNSAARPPSKPKVWFFAPRRCGTGTAHARFELCFKLPAKPMRRVGRHQIGRSRDVLSGATKRTKFGSRMENILWYPWLLSRLRLTFCRCPARI